MRMGRRLGDYLLALQPWSLSAFIRVFLVVVFATVIQGVFASFGSALNFATFFPAILIAGLLGGAPGGAFAVLLSVPIVWWAFMPPRFEFNPLTAADYDGIAVFLLCSAVAICFSHLCREALEITRKEMLGAPHCLDRQQG